MKIFVLEDDYNCDGVINWLRNKGDTIQIVRNIEDAFYLLEYEDTCRHFDKFVLDASLPEASVLYPDGTKKEYDGALNGIDFVMDNFARMGINLCKVAFLTAFYYPVNAYLKSNTDFHNIRIINKNDNDLTKRLQEFLDS